eukprot:CAMPEP_0181235826 /NCGR_PEP_ID=MMETSP1096-20121128/37803_1 /TAXON_ID=156174 ORGANISM="Chrysochromulina ericina, Strain CCMP281" /NCGR_SAMPLE_ID=MMETSP1096 /ASSEMBLY_ACC=CAM_ASM_000453 /LENGTH=96 /DNA_ID=CAMNT_0023330873 /DNA_START=118 /DNA_END=405 /DNA_ORIENTATION=-
MPHAHFILHACLWVGSVRAADSVSIAPLLSSRQPHEPQVLPASVLSPAAPPLAVAQARSMHSAQVGPQVAHAEALSLHEISPRLHARRRAAGGTLL